MRLSASKSSERFGAVLASRSRRSRPFNDVETLFLALKAEPLTPTHANWTCLEKINIELSTLFLGTLEAA